MKMDVTPLYSRLPVRLLRRFPNFDIGFIKPVRAEATGLMHLVAGNRVLDVGCGMGGSFPFLAKAVGATGEVLGVEISPAATESAQRRIEANRWSHVHVVQAPAHLVPLEGWYDGLLMFAAPDVYASVEALAHLLPHLRVGARIVLFGAKKSTAVSGRLLLNPLFKLAVAKLSFETTPLPDAVPWRLVGAVTKDLEVREYFFGTMFLASGSLVESWRTDLRRIAGPP